jgi:hypothetical protein
MRIVTLVSRRTRGDEIEAAMIIGLTGIVDTLERSAHFVCSLATKRQGCRFLNLTSRSAHYLSASHFGQCRPYGKRLVPA